MKNPKKPVQPVRKSAPIPVNGELQGWKRQFKEQVESDLKQVIPESLMKHGLRVIGDEKDFWKWLCKKPLGLHPDRGIDIMHTKEGQARIISLLGQIEHGVF